ncbi:MAG: HPr family phosphocarrier protein [Selenomonadaceae bacterium]|nr:HPr family phosphocarrier protein [Selenomonadaceae bacterium]
MPKNFFNPTTKLVDRAADGKLFDAAATTVIKNRTGIYDRTASLLVQKACEFDATIRFKAKGKTVDELTALIDSRFGETDSSDGHAR